MEDISFAIITPTYKRPEMLLMAIKSVENQTYKKYIHIIVNDSPETDYSHTEEELLHKKHIHYLKNEVNIGKNASLNKALQFLQKEKFLGYIIFLDDDDWLTENCLEEFMNVLTKEEKYIWLVSKRSYQDGKDITTCIIHKKFYSYSKEYLLLKIFKGDATHCIKSEAAFKIHFTTIIKNGEEWLYFSEIEKYFGRFLFLNKIGTKTNGYLDEGITQKYTPPSFLLLLKEIRERKIATIPIILWLLGRKIKMVFNNQ